LDPLFGPQDFFLGGWGPGWGVAGAGGEKGGGEKLFFFFPPPPPENTDSLCIKEEAFLCMSFRDRCNAIPGWDEQDEQAYLDEQREAEVQIWVEAEVQRQREKNWKASEARKIEQLREQTRMRAETEKDAEEAQKKREEQWEINRHNRKCHNYTTSDCSQQGLGANLNAEMRALLHSLHGLV